MDFNNNILTYKYLDNTSAPVSLLEYYVLEDDNCKYIGFKFNNNLNQILKLLNVTVDVFNEDGNLVERTGFELTLNVLANTSFVCNKKLKVVNAAYSIKINIEKAVFEKTYYDGKLKALTKEMAEDLLSSDVAISKSVTKSEKKELKERQKLNKKAIKVAKKEAKNKLNKKSTYEVKSLLASNLKIKHKFLVFIFFVALIVGVIYSEVIFTDKYGHFITEDNITYQITSDSASIYKAKKDITNFEVPKYVTYKDTNYTVQKICDKAFENTNIKTISFNQRIKIGAYAFKNTNLSTINNPEYIYEVSIGSFENTLLSSITLSNVYTIYQNTFANNTKLRTVNAPKAIVNDNAFAGSTKISNLTIKATVQDNFGSIFGDVESMTIDYLKFSNSLSKYYTFENNYFIYKLTIPKSSGYKQEKNVINIIYS